MSEQVDVKLTEMEEAEETQRPNPRTLIFDSMHDKCVRDSSYICITQQ